MLNKLEWGLSEPNLEGRKNEFTRQRYKRGCPRPDAEDAAARDRACPNIITEKSFAAKRVKILRQTKERTESINCRRVIKL